MSQKIDWDSGARFARLNYLISRDLANADRRPLWYKGDYFADQFAPHAPRALAPAAGVAAGIGKRRVAMNPPRRPSVGWAPQRVRGFGVHHPLGIPAFAGMTVRLFTQSLEYGR